MLEFPILQDLCGDVDRLLEAHENRTAAHFARDGEFGDLFSIQSCMSILEEHLLHPSMLKIIKDGVLVPKETLLVEVPVGGAWLSVIDTKKVMQHYKAGATIVYQGVQTFWEPCKSFARELEEEISHPVQLNVYLTPANCVGAPQHYDTHDVLVLQVEGSKVWEYGPVEFKEPLPRQIYKDKKRVPHDEEQRISKGDVFYLPRGVLHRCLADEERSLHITVGILNRTRISILDDLIEEAVEDKLFRVGLPLGFLRDKALGKKAVEDTVKAVGTWGPTVVDKVIQREKKELHATRRLP